MIRGLDIFKEFFRDFQDQYVLIGGAACDIVLSEVDLTDRKAAGQQVDDRDIRKHKNDVARLATLFTGNEACLVSASILADFALFIEAFEKEPPNIKALGIPGVTAIDIINMLKRVYALDSGEGSFDGS